MEKLFFKTNAELGLAEVLLGRVALRRAVRAAQQANLSI
jgi:hypothetical protein